MAYTEIDDPTDYFETKLYTGNGGTQSITGLDFAPNFVWLKDRDSSVAFHRLVDTIRGATKLLYSNGTNAEDTDATSLTSFNSDGFTLSSGGGVNASGNNYVSWNWKAGGSASSNSDGTLTSSVSASTTAGFSIVAYTGSGSTTSFGHGLGVAPKWVIIKNREDTDGWTVFHTGISSGQGYIFLNTTDAATTGSSRRFRYGDGSDGKLPDSTKVYLGNASDVNTSGEDYIAYCFAEKKGYSKFGSYTGNGNADGAFVYTGFKPAWILSKRTDNSSGGEWCVLDNKRDTFNVADAKLEANNSDAEETDEMYDILSNGFKITRGDGNINDSGGTYIYLAFAESPFVNSKGIPTNAR
jgi:hypothetical protein